VHAGSDGGPQNGFSPLPHTHTHPRCVFFVFPFGPFRFPLHTWGGDRKEKQKTEKQNRKTKQKNKTEKQNRKTKKKNKTEKLTKKNKETERRKINEKEKRKRKEK